MVKITKRIAEEQYCFTELEFKDLEEYKTQYVPFMRAYFEVKKKVRDEWNDKDMLDAFDAEVTKAKQVRK